MKKLTISALLLGLAIMALTPVVSAKEELVVYSTIFAPYQEAMKTEFERLNPGVTVHIINPGGTEAMLAKIEAEKDKPRADVMHSGGSAEYIYAKQKGLLEPIQLDVPATVKMGESNIAVKDSDGYYYAFTVQFSGIMVNTDELKRLGLPIPQSYADLANPIYKGLIVSANPLRSSTAVTNVMAIYQSYGKDKAWELWDKIDKNIGFYSDSSSKIYLLTARGEYPISMVVNRPVYEYQMQGYPVKFIVPADGTQVQDNSMAVIKGAPHPELAKEFIQFCLGKDLQAAGAKFGYTPLASGAVDPSADWSLESLQKIIKKVSLPDAELSEAVRPEIQSKFEAYMRNR